MVIRQIVTILLLLCIPVGVSVSASPQSDLIRVVLQKGEGTVTLDGRGVIVTDGSGEGLRFPFPLEVRRAKNGLSVNGKTMNKLVASAPAFVLVNGKGYRGSVEVVPGDKGVLVINELPLEEYLVGLINCEISSQWPIEAIKAQAVIARSYAVYQRDARRNALYHLESSVIDQVYDGCNVEDARAARGVEETAGEVLTYGGSVIQSFYHSNCGGHTEASENVWGYPFPYLQGVDCTYCLSAPSVKWEQTIPLKKIEALLRGSGYKVSKLRNIEAGRRNKSGRLADLTMVSARGSVTLPAVTFRKLVGFGVIKSTNFEVRTVDENAFFSGLGYGHGVGLCQWGAKQRAADGFDYREILSYYYPGTRVEKVLND